MAETDTTLYDLSSQVITASRKAAYALMQSNYVERRAPELPGGKISGLAPEARDIAVRLRDSIWSRFDSLRFHHDLMVRLRESHRRQREQLGPSADSFDEVWSTLWHAHYLFDDIVFNAISLCDYLSSAVWFGFHGQNYIKKRWNKTYEAAKNPDRESRMPNGPRIHNSRTGALVRDYHETFVNALYGYRSDLIHDRADGPRVFTHQLWEDGAKPDFTVRLPEAYVRRLSQLVPEIAPGDRDVDMVHGAELLIRRLACLALDLLVALPEDLGWREGEPLTILS